MDRLSISIHTWISMKRFLFLIFFSLLISSCAHLKSHQSANGFYSGPTCKEADFYGDLNSEFAMAGARKETLQSLKLQKIDDSTIKFTGVIENGDADALKELLKSKPKRLVVKSAGGEATEALKMAELLKVSTVEEIVVDRICLSSCASYLFIAVPKKWIRDGIVGFHGNATALFNDPDLVANLMKENQKSEAAVKKWIADNKERGAKREQAFLSSVGVEQSLFDLSQRKDKGQEDGKVYPFFLPGPKKMSQYGIKNVRGDQNRCLGESVGMENLYSD
jgi:hypothetical protein